MTLLIGISSNGSYAQKDGYWDKERATKKEIVVSARDRIIIKSDELPVGTTEVVYRITLLDENQQLATSLVSVLKSIPDPTGISQGSAGAIFLMSKISGVDKCKYVVFANEILASDYVQKGSVINACFVQKEAISKDAKRLSLGKSSCFTVSSPVMWFGFESKNWILKQKIVLEVVPWVNIKLSRGWGVDNRKLIINQCKTSQLANKIENSDDFCVCILEKIQKDYSFQEFQKLLTIEKSKVFKDHGNVCYEETGASKIVYTEIRNQAAEFIKQANYGSAITKLQIIITDKKATAQDYSAIGRAYLMTKQYDKAIKFLKEGERLDDTELLLKLDLAHAYLLNNKFSSAKTIHKKYQTQNVTDSLGWVQKVKIDFEYFKKAGLSTADFERVLRLFKN
ncbi:tetratricopeptide repeat protein [Flavobacterium sp.]|uniref:tetratricopeptide repeat protein n=1 Tax=Flavobacterium sp. TaxID=239 RepID=UPI0038FCF83D